MEITKEHDMFVMPSLNTVINLDYVDHIRFGTIYLTNGQKFRCHRKVLAYVKHYLSGAAH
jgi:glutamine synthetase